MKIPLLAVLAAITDHSNSGPIPNPTRRVRARNTPGAFGKARGSRRATQLCRVTAARMALN